MRRIIGSILLSTFSFLTICIGGVTTQDRQVFQETLDKLYNKMHTTTLDNGMTVICVPQSHTNQVSINICYDVGNMHEEPHEFGMAHLVEHMIFKGTKKMAEGDMERLTSKFGMSRTDGKFNATTWLDRTNYYFHTDAANWKVFVDLMADCAQNMDWDSKVLDSELAAIFQEIKLRGRDQIGHWQDMLSNWLPHNHPYSHRGIGYKEQLLHFTREDVLAFYHKNYTPDRAILMVVGNIDPTQVIAHVRDVAFANFKGTRPAQEQTPEPFYVNFAHTNRVIYHTQQYHQYMYYWRGPRKQTADAAAMQYIYAALNRRINQEWVDKKGWCLQAGIGGLSVKEDGLSAFSCMPKPEHLEVPYDKLLTQVIADIIENGISEEEYQQAHRATLRGLVDVSEYAQMLTTVMNEQFFPSYTGQGWYEANTLFNNVTQEQIKAVAHKYLRPFLMHTTKTIPLPAEEQATWNALQVKTDAHEQVLLEQRRREVVQSTAEHDDAMVLPERQELAHADDPEPEATFALSNGLKVHYAHNAVSPTVSIVLTLADSQAVELSWAVQKKGFAATVWSDMLMHGTVHKTKQEVDDAFAAMGAGVMVSGSLILLTCFKQDLDKALALVCEVLTQPALPQDILERKQRDFVEGKERQKNNWIAQIKQHITNTVHAPYPWSFTEQQQIEQAQAITREDVRAYHQVMTDPSCVTCAISGDVSQDDAHALLEKHLKKLEGVDPGYSAPVIPELTAINLSEHIELPTEEIGIYAVRPTVTRDAAEHPLLMVLDRYLLEHVWDVRQQTGLFYSGNSLFGPGTKRLPGSIAIVSQTQPTRVDELLIKLREVLTTIHAKGISKEDFDRTKDEWLHGATGYTTTNATVVGHIAGCVREQKGWQHKKQTREAVRALTLEQANAAIAKYYDVNTWSFFTAGRR